MSNLLQLKNGGGRTEVRIEAGGHAMRPLQIDLIRDANRVLFAEVGEVADGQRARARRGVPRLIIAGHVGHVAGQQEA